MAKQLKITIINGLFECSSCGSVLLQTSGVVGDADNVRYLVCLTEGCEMRDEPLSLPKLMVELMEGDE